MWIDVKVDSFKVVEFNQIGVKIELVLTFIGKNESLIIEFTFTYKGLAEKSIILTKIFNDFTYFIESKTPTRVKFVENNLINYTKFKESIDISELYK